MNAPTFNLRPGVNNRNQWQSVQRKRAVPDKIRKMVLARDENTCMSCSHKAAKWMQIHHLEDTEDDELENLSTLCPAPHAVMHIGFSLMHGSIEIWKAPISQIDIIRTTREGIRRGQTLAEINASLNLKRGRFAPNSANWANDLLASMGPEPRAELPEPLCAVFVAFKQWQVDA